MPKEMTILDKAKLELVMRRFNFARVRGTMKLTGWTWGDVDGDGVPDINQLQVAAERLLSLVFQEGGTISSGGFVAEYDGNNFFLQFVVEDSNSFIDGEENDPPPPAKPVNNLPPSNAISSLDLSEEK